MVVGLAELDELVRHYNEGLSALLDKHAPLCNKTIVLRPNAPWYSEDLRMAKRSRRKLERKWLCSRLTVDHQIYREQCALVAKLLHQTKIAYFSSKVAECEGDQKKLFKIAKHLLGERSEAVLPTHSLPCDLAEKFNTFFVQKISLIRDKLQSKQTRGPNSIQNTARTYSGDNYPPLKWRPQMKLGKS